jgi:hypothetical protein
MALGFVQSSVGLYLNILSEVFLLSFLTGFGANMLYSTNNNYWLCPEALSRLNVVIRHPNALEPDNIMAYDNAVSALGKICQFHRDSIDSAQVFPSSPPPPPPPPPQPKNQKQKRKRKFNK